MVKIHECGDEYVENWESFEIGGLGETVERIGYCKKCGKRVREIWVYSTTIVDE